jgi:uncharacterized protein (TIGR01244 family)
MELKEINDTVCVSGQIEPGDLKKIKQAGFVAIVNNRPDNEVPGQPTGAEIEAAAKAIGLAYYHVPMGREGVTPEMIAATRSALQTSDGKVLCYCRTGTRSTTLWALSQAGALPADDIIAAAASAGYDLTHLGAHLTGDTD